MQLMMYIGNDLIEAVPLQKEGLRQPGYLGKFKRHLKMKYSELISQSPQPRLLSFEPHQLSRFKRINKFFLTLTSPLLSLCSL
jgi:hypothetical protein